MAICWRFETPDGEAWEQMIASFARQIGVDIFKVEDEALSKTLSSSATGLGKGGGYHYRKFHRSSESIVKVYWRKEGDTYIVSSNRPCSQCFILKNEEGFRWNSKAKVWWKETTEDLCEVFAKLGILPAGSIETEKEK